MTTRNHLAHWPVVLLSAIVGLIIILIGVSFYTRSQAVLADQLRSRLAAVAGAAALSIDGEALDHIRGIEDANSPDYRMLIDQLQKVRTETDMRFVYVLRKTQDPMMLEFIGDADATLSFAELDANGNRAIDPDEEAAQPGELYDISETPMLQQDAFDHAVADPGVSVDQWGTLVSGYAPIRRSDGSVSAVLGIDMYADDFDRLSRSIFSPQALIAVLISAFAIAGGIASLWELRRVQVLKRINAERSGLLRLTFHQLGEPLTIMKWSLETLRDETASPELKKLVEEHVVCMDEGLGRLNSIIDTLQLAEKVDLNTLEYLPVPASLKALVDNAVDEWHSSLQSRKQTIKIDMGEDVMIPMDKTLLLLVMRQILVNAIEYSPDGSQIDICVRPGRTSVELVVTDKGCGIPPKDIEHLFEKYRRAGNAHLKKPDGNGLGLYIAKGIIEKAGGTIWLESKEGQGTQVHFTLPM